ncbi:MAG TPA: PQQ-binding-like beta-propeller repeat protein [Hyphomonadaceae bacterium]|nr:PQQ-binding-like beta-propeller repeat protein [Hyphomonadaceae bacterium]HPI48200.1 PQQ-binding-like beta-propeller repeat protein [Hyphomonadaceae bacterium]
MKLRTMMRLAGLGFGLGLFTLPATAQVAPDHPGRAVYNKSCAMCHDNPGATRAATLASIQQQAPARLREVLTTGVMAPMAASLSPQEVTDVIAFLTAGQAAAAANWTDALMCTADKRAVSSSATIVSAGFGVDQNQTRSLSAAQAGLKKSDLANLEVAWSIAFPGQGAGTGASVLSDGTIFVTGGQKVLALDAKTGCAKWAYSASSRNTPAIGAIGGRKVVAMSVGRDIHVLDAATGALIWKASGQPVNGTGGNIRGGVIFAKDKIIVPLSASGVGSGANPRTECCTGHGSVVALNAADGKHVWEYHTMPEPEYNGQVNSVGVKQKGPSGAPIWSVPVFDAKRNHVIVTTGENTSHPSTDTSDAVIALDADTGKVAWQYQAMAADVWNMACDTGSGSNGPNCPVLFGGDGRDYDFGAGAIITSAGGKDVVLAGQKSGHAWVLDAATGKVIWSQRVGEGTALGGVHWGIATDGANFIVPINDPLKMSANKAFIGKAGVYAFDLKTGKPSWSFLAQPDCAGERATLVASCTDKFGFSAAPLIIDGAIIGATLGGQVIVIDAKTGAAINRFDTVGSVTPLNKDIAGRGGSIDSHGISAGAGMVFINSGYGAFGQTGGNALIAYRPKQ